ncbi:MAG: PAS-domain containing protein [Pseudomonadota bacterium]
MSQDLATSLTTSGLNLIAQALSIYDKDLRLAVCNVRFQQMFNLPDALVTPGADFAETIHYVASHGEYGEIDDIDAFVQDRVDLARAFKPHYVERTRPDGRSISIEGAPLPQGGWVAVYTDISQIKNQEALLRARASDLNDQVLAHAEALSASNRALVSSVSALEEAKRQLTETEARTRLTTQMMPAHIAHVDASGTYTFSNRRLSAVLPGRSSDIVGKPIAEALGQFAFSRIKDTLMRAYAGTPGVLEFTDEASARHIRVAFTPDGAGGTYILSMDVTEETQARVALEQTQKRELAVQMTSGLTHDFSNLLTIILGLQSKLTRIDGLPDEARALIDGTLAATRRGGTLLRAISDVTAGRDPRPQATALAPLLDEIATLARSTLPDGLTLVMPLAPPPGRFMLDPGMVQDSLLNLILNARDACGRSGRITVDVAALHDTWLEFTVTDTGPGFSAEALDMACDPFFTTKGSEGSGLGLPQVYDMTKRSGGHLRLDNPGTGARVRLRLPQRTAPELGEGLVLLVEDDASLREQFRDMMMDLGHAVIEAGSVDEAIALSADIPDITLVLSDINLGTGTRSGVDIARQLGGDLPVILMTSLPGDDPLRVEAAQTAPILQKPFSARDFVALFSPQAAQ